MEPTEQGTDVKEETSPAAPPYSHALVFALGVTQILTWGSSYYLPAVLGKPIAQDTGWSMSWIIGGLTIGLLTSGFSAPLVGGLIQKHGGRPVLAASSVLMCAGLVLLGSAQSVFVYSLAWVVVGAAMGAGMYDAAFATLGRIYGVQARRAITNLTLFGGFTSAIAWPASAVLVEYVGWRGACFAYAAIHGLFSLPVHLLFVPKAPVATSTAGKARTEQPTPARLGKPFFTLAFVVSASAAISGTITVNLLIILQASGHSLASAVTLGALIGPAMVVTRVLEKSSGERLSPLQLLILSQALFVVCAAILMTNTPLLSLPALLAFAAGLGVGMIARGTAPLHVFGPQRYASVVGKIAMPAVLSQAIAPSVSAAIAELWGVGALLFAIGLLALLSTSCAILLTRMSRRPGAD